MFGRIKSLNCGGFNSKRNKKEKWRYKWKMTRHVYVCRSFHYLPPYNLKAIMASRRLNLSINLIKFIEWPCNKNGENIKMISKQFLFGAFYNTTFDQCHKYCKLNGWNWIWKKIIRFDKLHEFWTKERKKKSMKWILFKLTGCVWF